MFCSEDDVKQILRNIIGNIDAEGDVFVYQRTVDKDTFTRLTTFVIPTHEGNEALINAIERASISDEYDGDFKFVKSEINVEDKAYPIDYLFVQANITPKLT